MAYTKTVWVNDTAPAINDTNLNKIEQGIYDNDTAIGDITDLETTATDLVSAINEVNSKTPVVHDSYSTSTTDGYSCEYVNSLQPKLLWENNPVQDLAEGSTITLSSNDYDFLEIYYNRNTLDLTYMYMVKVKKGSGCILSAIGAQNGAYPWIRERDITYVNDTTFTVSTGYFQRTNATSPTTGANCVPIAIYGYKFK